MDQIRDIGLNNINNDNVNDNHDNNLRIIPLVQPNDPLFTDIIDEPPETFFTNTKIENDDNQRENKLRHAAEQQNNLAILNLEQANERLREAEMNLVNAEKRFNAIRNGNYNFGQELNNHFEIQRMDTTEYFPLEQNRWILFGFLLLFIVFILIPIVMFFISVVDNIDDTLEWIFIIFFVILLFIIASLGFFMIINHYKDPSISSIVAQRYNRLSYFLIICIVTLATFTSFFIIAGGISRTNFGKDNNDVIVFVGFLSPILMMGILICPVPVTRENTSLGIDPIKESIQGSTNANDLNINARLTVGVRRFYKLNFWKPTDICCNWGHDGADSESNRNIVGNRSDKCHSIFFFLGLACGWTNVICHLCHSNASKFDEGIEIYFIIISGLSSLCFMVFINLGKKILSCSWFQCGCCRNLLSNRFLLILEFLGLYYTLMSLVLVSVIAGDLITD